MNSHRIKTALTENGKLLLQDLPFEQGDEIEAIIRKSKSLTQSDLDTLENSVVAYREPFEPVISPEEWNANN